eukprot:747314-Hanusia_phi.AAC.5
MPTDTTEVHESIGQSTVIEEVQHKLFSAGSAVEDVANSEVERLGRMMIPHLLQLLRDNEATCMDGREDANEEQGGGDADKEEVSVALIVSFVRSSSMPSTLKVSLVAHQPTAQTAADRLRDSHPHASRASASISLRSRGRDGLVFPSPHSPHSPRPVLISPLKQTAGLSPRQGRHPRSETARSSTSSREATCLPCARDKWRFLGALVKRRKRGEGNVDDSCSVLEAQADVHREEVRLEVRGDQLRPQGQDRLGSERVQRQSLVPELQRPVQRGYSRARRQVSASQQRRPRLSPQLGKRPRNRVSEPASLLLLDLLQSPAVLREREDAAPRDRRRARARLLRLPAVEQGRQVTIAMTRPQPEGVAACSS